MALFVAALSHKNAAVELREQLAVDEDKLRELLRDMAGAGVVREAIILSTCPARRAPRPSASSAATAAWSPPRSRRHSTPTPRATRFATRSAWPRASIRW